jgi:CheY-like chemotaxis protein
MKMMQNDRLISLGQLAAGVGHEINNPLCSILLKLELLQEEKRALNSDEADKVLSEIKEGLERIKYITNDLKTLARNRDEDVLSNIDVNRILKATIHMTHNEIEHRAKLVFEPGEIKPVYANEARMSQVFLNILINAIQAIEPGHADENEISVKTKLSSGHVIMEFRDTGSGIPDEMKDRLFQPFQTTKPVGQGTGLGLSICDSIIRKYNGVIEYESIKGKGSLFKVILPVSEIRDTVQPVTSAVNSSQGKLEKTGRRVLIVDDDKEVLGMFHSIVSRKFEATSFSDSREAIKSLADGQKYDCIICDLMMPNLGGMEFYQKLKEVSPEHCQKIIFITGGSFTSVTDQFLRTSGIIFMEKPISFKDLLGAIERIVQVH